MICYKFDFESFKKGSKGDSVEDVQISIPTVILGINEGTFGDAVDLGKDAGQDIADSSIYSLKDEKLKAGEDMKLSEADKIKKRRRERIRELQSIFQQVVALNQSETDSLAKLTP